jgi:pyrroline-5-carboxylate reductase
MGEAWARGLTESGAVVEFRASTRSEASAKDAASRLGMKVSTDNARVVSGAAVVLLAVKPHQAEVVLRSLRPELSKSKPLLISICAGVTTSQLSEWAGPKVPVVRAMPNTPALIRQGMTVLCAGPSAIQADLDFADQLFAAVGRTAQVEESLMDGVTGLSGCGPAYVYLMIEALSEAGVKVGLPRETATLLAAQTLSGASQMVLARGVHPAALKDEVTTPAGCTIDGLMALEEGRLRMTLIKAVLAATERSQGLRAGK